MDKDKIWVRQYLKMSVEMRRNLISAITGIVDSFSRDGYPNDGCVNTTCFCCGGDECSYARWWQSRLSLIGQIST